MKKTDDEALVDAVICSLCADYARRKRCIEKKEVDKRVRMEYSYLNARILDAAAGIVGIPWAEIFIYEIGEKIGYAASRVDNMSEVTYKLKKQAVKEAILRGIYYI